MKQLFLTLSGICLFISLQAQNVGVGTNNPSAKLDVSATNSGILIPRVALTATNAAGPVTAPVTSMMVYNTATAGAGGTTVTPGFYYWNGTAWVRVIDNNSLAGATTHTLGLATNTLTSVVNGVSATSNTVSGVSNTSSANTLSTTVNGVIGSTVPIINTNVLSLGGTSVTSTINGSASNALDLSSLTKNIYNTDGTLSGARTLTMSGNTLNFTGGNVGIGASSPSALLDVTGTTASDAKLHLLNTSTGNAGMEIRGAAAGSQQYIDFTNGSTSNTGAGTPDYTNRIISNSTALTFSTNAAANGIILFNGGNVSIGTASSLNTLAINNAGTTAATTTSYPLGIARAGSVDLTMGSDASNTYVQSWNSKPLIINSQGNAINFSNSASTVTVANLAGTGNRPVYANSSGTLTTADNAFYTVSANLAFSRDDIGTTAWPQGWTYINNNTLTSGSTDDGYIDAAMGFGITIGGVSYTNVRVCTNGWLEFTNSGSAAQMSTANTNLSLPISSTTNPFLAFYWDDMVTLSEGIRIATVGASPNRTFVVDYRAYTYSTDAAFTEAGPANNGSNDDITLQVTIHEGSGLITVRYYQTETYCNGANATIGFQGAGGSNAKALPVTYNGKVFDDNYNNQGQQFVSFSPVR